MRTPRVTTRRLMVAVVIAGVVLSIPAWPARRSAFFRLESARHEPEWSAELNRDGRHDEATPKSDHHFEMARKYERAAFYPRLRVAPDPHPP